jgi:hypothetical protein
MGTRQRPHHLEVLGREDRPDEDDAVDVVLGEDLEVLDLGLLVVVGVAEDELVAGVRRRPRRCPAIMRPTDSELILGRMTPTSLVFPVRRVWAWLDGT